jgi:hypothetical protein
MYVHAPSLDYSKNATEYAAEDCDTKCAAKAISITNSRSRDARTYGGGASQEPF